MYSVTDTTYVVGFPIRTFTDQSLIAAPRDLSQRTTSFIASDCQGIHQLPFGHLNSLHTELNKPMKHVYLVQLFDTQRYLRSDNFLQTYSRCTRILTLEARNEKPEAFHH